MGEFVEGESGSMPRKSGREVGLENKLELTEAVLAWFFANHEMKLADLRRLAGNIASSIGHGVKPDDVMEIFDHLLHRTKVKVFDLRRLSETSSRR